MGGMARTKDLIVSSSSYVNDPNICVLKTETKKNTILEKESSNKDKQVLADIRRLQRSQKNLICLKPFERVLKLSLKRGACLMRIRKNSVNLRRDVSEFY